VTARRFVTRNAEPSSTFAQASAPPLTRGQLTAAEFWRNHQRGESWRIAPSSLGPKQTHPSNTGEPCSRPPIFAPPGPAGVFGRLTAFSQGRFLPFLLAAQEGLGAVRDLVRCQPTAFAAQKL